jgi:type IV pilus assembly protein PilC
MATGAIAKTKPRVEVKESVFHWEGRDKNGRVVKGEMRAGGGVSQRRCGVAA